MEEVAQLIREKTAILGEASPVYVASNSFGEKDAQEHEIARSKFLGHVATPVFPQPSRRPLSRTGRLALRSGREYDPFAQVALGSVKATPFKLPPKLETSIPTLPPTPRNDK